MGRRSRVPDGWISLYRVARDHGLNRYTLLVERLCNRWGFPVRRYRGTACMRVKDLPEWRDSLWQHQHREKILAVRPPLFRPRHLRRRRKKKPWRPRKRRKRL